MRLRMMAAGVLRRALRLLLALAVLGALSPAAFALPVEQAAAGPAPCCGAPPSCDAASAVCVTVCQAVSPSGIDNAQTPAFAADCAPAEARDRVLPSSAGPTSLGDLVAQADPPAYLRFHRFLL